MEYHHNENSTIRLYSSRAFIWVATPLGFIWQLYPNLLSGNERRKQRLIYLFFEEISFSLLVIIAMSLPSVIFAFL